MPSTLSKSKLAASEPSINVNLPQFPSRQRHATAVPARPYVVPTVVPDRVGRRAPFVVRFNRALRTVLVGLCGLAILGYGLDVATSSDVSKLQEQARRLSEQNSELSAELLRAISFQGIQESVLGRFGLRVPEQVIVVKEATPPIMTTFKLSKHQLPIISGY
jgi:hypothetical protein